MDRGAWRARVRGVAKSQTRLKQLSMHAHTHSSKAGIETKISDSTFLSSGDLWKTRRKLICFTQVKVYSQAFMCLAVLRDNREAGDSSSRRIWGMRHGHTDSE